MKLLSMLFLAAVAIPQETRQAEDLLKDALSKAKESKLKVFLTFGSPG